MLRSLPGGLNADVFVTPREPNSVGWITLCDKPLSHIHDVYERVRQSECRYMVWRGKRLVSDVNGEPRSAALLGQSVHKATPEPGWRFVS